MRPDDEPEGIDADRPVPLWVQLKALLISDIARGRYGTDGRLPTEHEMCELYGISRTPVHHALSDLAEEGVILRHRKRGSFVNPHWLERDGSAQELRVVVPDGPWERQLRRAAPSGLALNIARVGLPDLHRTLTRAVAEGRGPDLAVLDSVWVAEFAASGFLRPLDELAPQWVAEQYEPDFLEPFVDVGSSDGRPVAVQAEVDLAGIWCRRGDLAGLGGQAPGNWSDLVTAATSLADRYPVPIALPGGSRAGEAATYCLSALLASNGAAVLTSEGVTVDCPAAERALDFLHELVDRGLVAPDSVAYEWDQPIRLLGEGNAGISFGGSYEGPALARFAGLTPNAVWDHFVFAPVPAGPSPGRANLAGGMAYGIFQQASRPELAMRLIDSVVSSQALVEMAERTGQIPSRRSAAKLVAGHSGFLATTTRMLETAAVRPATRYYARVSAFLQSLLEAVIGGEPASVACRRAAEGISAITGQPIVVRQS